MSGLDANLSDPDVRKFLLNLLLFLCVTAICIVGFHYFILKNRAKILSLPPDVTKVVLGNSTIETSVNDSILPNTFNFARSSEPYDAVYAKLKLIHRYNPTIDTLILGFDDIILAKDIYMMPGKESTFLIDQLSVSDWLKNIKDAKFEHNTAWVSSLYGYYNIHQILTASNTFNANVGGYHYLLRDLLQIDIAKRTKEYEKPLNNVSDFPEICRYYLNNIIEFCNINDIKLIFLSTPRHDPIRGDTIYREIHKKFYNSIPLIDLNTMEFPDSCWGDCHHLNYKGAKVFSERLDSILRNLN